MTQHVGHRASDEIARLNGELDRLQAEVERHKRQIHRLQSISPYNHTAPELAADNMRLRASLEWALQALDPLAPEDWWGNFLMAEQHKKACDLVGYVPLKKEESPCQPQD